MLLIIIIIIVRTPIHLAENSGSVKMNNLILFFIHLDIPG